MSTTPARTPEERAKGRAAIKGAAIAFVVVMVVFLVIAITSGNYAIAGALVAIAGGTGVALWTSWQDVDRDGDAAG